MKPSLVFLLACPLAFISSSSTDCWAQAAAQAQAAEAEVEVVELVVDMAEDQFGEPATMLLRGYLRVNCALARRCCELSQEQEQALSRLDNAWIDRQIADANKGPVKRAAVGIARFLGGAVGNAAAMRVPANSDPQAVVAAVKTKINDELTAALTEEQQAVWKHELEAREAFNKQAQAAVLVAALDNRLFLTNEQRETLQQQVATWLTKSKDLYCQFYLQNESYLPNIPKQVLSSVLSAEQIEALAGAQTYNYEAWQMEMQAMDQAPVLIER